MYMEEGELEFDKDEMAALDFHASELAGNLSGGNDSGSKAGRLSDAVAAAAYRTNSNLPDYGSSACPADPCVRFLCI